MITMYLDISRYSNIVTKYRPIYCTSYSDKIIIFLGDFKNQNKIIKINYKFIIKCQILPPFAKERNVRTWIPFRKV